MGNQSMQLVLQYFFSVGLGVGFGLTVSVLVPIALYKKFGGKAWRGKRNNKSAI